MMDKRTELMVYGSTTIGEPYVSDYQRSPSNPMTVKFSGRKIGRNEPCPCGSGKKFKKCHQLKGMRGVK